MRVRWGAVAVAMVVAPLAACAPDPEPPTAIFLGDADTVGAALPDDQAASRWPTLVSQHFGWREVNAGCDGSGYVTTGDTCETTYRERVDRVLEEDPDVIVVSGGLADLGGTLGEIEAAVHATFLTLDQTFPDAKIYVTGTLSAGAGYDAEALNAIVQEQAQRVGAVYFDLGDPLEGRPELVSAGGHPNADGHAVIAELTSNVLGGS
ncbi:SGNH/GDSL hydrolase family protein [Demequina sp. NBRC 110053]|uniref:SGNH/GDSL hydrolase family protein n=1 Tax=Demequina sp. NBRC 110053 TaxID=1570342 RepID=UPI0009FE7212|nr:SGNH/GDSL hydrolase family protein [Demequina sp. NBRC 110053]